MISVFSKQSQTMALTGEAHPEIGFGGKSPLQTDGDAADLLDLNWTESSS